MVKPKIVVLDGHALNPGDIEWGPVASLGDLVVHDRSGAQIVQRAADAELVLINKEVLSAEIIEQLAELRYIGVLATGVNIVDLAAATGQGVVVTNVPGYGADSVAQHVFALLLEMNNHVAEHAAAVNDGQWSRCPDFCFNTTPIHELAGRTLGIFGVGAIGRRVAKIGSAFGMRVVAAHQDSETSVEIPGTSIEWMSIDEVFSNADVITLHCPLTDETHHLVNSSRLQRMKPQAVLINTGRGGLVDEAALAAALSAGTLAGAAVDVVSSEPPSDGNLLIDSPRCLVTPHVAWSSVEARRRLMQIAADNIAAFLDGQPTNVVNADVLDTQGEV